MSVIKNCVLLLKSENPHETTDKYNELLTKNGYKIQQVKTLVFNYKNLCNLKKKLQNPDDYTGIILSSPRCVNSVYLADNNCNDLWKYKKNFVVGEATFDAAKNKIGLVCEGSETGNANNLADLIIESKVYLMEN